ncbi:MAG: LCP family protein [Candidatus Saccharibacteria bacterium]|nr:LCP family protein [Candidatus Saccharibacteria bacterium]
MSNKNNSIDGFSLRRRDTNRVRNLGAEPVPERFLKENATVKPVHESTRHKEPSAGLKRSDIDESLKKFEEKPFKKKKRITKKGVKKFLKILLVIIVLIGGFLAIKAFIAGSKIFGGNLFDAFSSSQPLKQDENGRSNILIFGTSEDDPNDHDGAALTDSIMVVSLDQTKKVAAITSVPRDLWVKYDDDCEFGYQGKINVVYECSDPNKKEGEYSEKGAEALRKKVGEVYGLDVQYSVFVGYKAVQQAVDAVGGVDVKIESSDPRGILDRNFDWECNFKCYYVKYPNGPAHLDGKHALALSRARNDAGGYGLSRGNFDREINQQKVLIALRNKASSAGTLANPVAATKLIDSLGDNIRTNFVSGEIKTLIDLAKVINEPKIDRFSLVDADPALLTTGMISGQSAVEPTAGTFVYTDIHSYIQKRLTQDEATKENASIVVLNGSGVPGAAKTMKDKLTAKGFSVTNVGDATVSQEYGKAAIYKVSKTKQPATTAKLKKTLKTNVKTSAMPYGMTADADFVVIVGQ